MKIFVFSSFLRSEQFEEALQQYNSSVSDGISISQMPYTSPGVREDNVAELINKHAVGVVDPFLFAPYAATTKVQWITSTYTGVNEITNALAAGGVAQPLFVLTRLGGVYGVHIAEYVIGQIIAYERSFHLARLDQSNKFWNENARVGYENGYRLLGSLSIAVLGVGDIGGEVAKACKSLGMTVCGLTHNTRGNPNVDKYFTRGQLPQLLSSVDYVCNLLPGSSETDLILSGDMFKHCAAKKAVFINVGRGNVCSELDIINALDSNYLRYAILDVYPVEPLPLESKLWTHPRVTCTPHNSCRPTHHLMVQQIMKNFDLFIKNLPLEHQISFDNKNGS